MLTKGWHDVEKTWLPYDLSKKNHASNGRTGALVLEKGAKSMNKRYIRGRRAEYKTIKLLKQQGWYPIRSAGSKGLWDVVAYCEYGWLCVQVKTAKPTKKDFGIIEKAIVPPLTAKSIWHWQKHTNLPIIHKIGEIK